MFKKNHKSSYYLEIGQDAFNNYLHLKSFDIYDGLICYINLNLAVFRYAKREKKISKKVYTAIYRNRCILFCEAVATLVALQ
jgi:hypothetical protein